jgi:metal-responsive CopG/Arc/MetJ family transcriptional regulator
MKIAISLPDPLSKEAKAAAKDLGLSRSELIQAALEEFLKRRQD